MSNEKQFKRVFGIWKQESIIMCTQTKIICVPRQKLNVPPRLVFYFRIPPGPYFYRIKIVYGPRPVFLMVGEIGELPLYGRKNMFCLYKINQYSKFSHLLRLSAQQMNIFIKILPKKSPSPYEKNLCNVKKFSLL